MVNNTLKTIGIVVCSTRPNRVGYQVSQWVERILAQNIDTTTTQIKYIDLQKENLPFLDELAPPKAGKPYVNAHTIAWSEKVASFDSFIFVSPIYNGSIPGALKNAVDYLWKEWTKKPTMVVTYGSTGGKGSNDFLYTLLGGALGMNLIPQDKTVLISLKRDFYVPDTNQFIDIDRDLLPNKETLLNAIQELKNLPYAE
ncbi:hypothetical protein RB653_001364 [Dictyostelium firmibasis]|uniref:FMN reductase [NAD(P)H] n=1 Tax=Dictyostelium firmibasis TaxID=79012 RepID=A0AAN7U415_9MYCE